MINAVDIVRFIGFSHLLQPPVTAFLASPKGLDLRRKIHTNTHTAELVVENMGFASVILPTALGVLLAVHADQVVAGGAARAHAALIALFWCWRLARQFRLHSVWKRELRKWSYFLFAVFLIQGPALATVLVVTARR